MKEHMSAEEKRAVADKHMKKVKISIILIIVSLIIVLITVGSFGKADDMLINIGIYGGGGLLLFSTVYRGTLNHCPFCNMRLDTSFGRRSPLDLEVPKVCPRCGEKLRYEYYESYK